MSKGTDPLEVMAVSPHARRTRGALRAWTALLLAFLWLPIVFLVLFSFEDSKTVGFPIPGFTLDWYRGLPTNGPLMSAVENSILVALFTAFIGSIVGTMAAFVLVRAGLRFPNGARILVTMPIMFPGVLIGLALLIFLAGIFHIRLGLGTVVAGHLVLTVPFVILIVAARLQGFDRRLEWAAADLGASPARTLRHIVLPLIAPAILAGALISITLSIDEFVVTFFTVGPQLTLPIYIYTQVKIGVTPEVNAVATLMLIGTVLLLGAVTLVASQGRRAARALRARLTAA
ncbi:MAG: ABC transporter permease [Candidatus Limnocylindrales bacterium]